jgi:hypothetical protein
MNRWGSYGRRDTQEKTDVDLRFAALDMVRERSLLGAGVLARSENKRLRLGTAADRLGTAIPTDFNPLFTKPFLGSFVYNNPNGEEMMLIAEKDQHFVWVLEFGKDPVQVPIHLTGTPADNGFELVDGVEFVQNFDKVIVLRRPNLWADSGGVVHARPILVWDGFVTADPGPPVHTGKFEPMALSTYGRLLVSQNSWSGEPFKDRIIYYNQYRPDLPARDQLIVSDPGDSTSYDDVFGVYRINSGQADFIVRVWAYFRNGIVVFKAKTLHFLSNFTIDPTLAVQTPFSVNRGACGTGSIVEVGTDVMFLSEPDGIYRLTEVITEKVTTEAAPASEPLQPVIDRINWAAAKSLSAGGACAQTLELYTYFGVPLDGALRNNTIIVYNNNTRQWESIDTWTDPDFGFHAMHIASYNDARRLFAIDYTKSIVYLLYEGFFDDTFNGSNHIDSLIETRGYAGPGEYNRFHRMQLAISTFNPEINITAITDGFSEEKLITEDGPITKNREKFYPHGHPDYFDPDATGDPLEPRRLDYSSSDEEFAVQDFEGLALGDVESIPGTAPSGTGPTQQSVERKAVRANGRWVSFRIENTKGRCEIQGVGVDSTQVPPTVRVAA